MVLLHDTKAHTHTDTHVRTHMVPVRAGGHRVLCGQGDAAGSDDQQDAHLKVSQVHHVVTHPPHTGTQEMTSLRK